MLPSHIEPELVKKKLDETEFRPSQVGGHVAKKERKFTRKAGITASQESGCSTHLIFRRH